MSLWPLWMITELIAISKGSEHKWPSEISNLFKLRKQELCEFGYIDYESCDNYVTTGVVKSRDMNELLEYSSGENNIDKTLPDVTDVEEKRGGHRPGCDCQLSSEFIDNGAFTYPRFIRNVTCDGHTRCQHSRPRGLHCLPIHYEVSVLKRKDRKERTESTESLHLPASLNCCWRAETIQVVVGCICGHKTRY